MEGSVAGVSASFLAAPGFRRVVPRPRPRIRPLGGGRRGVITSETGAGGLCERGVRQPLGTACLVKYYLNNTLPESARTPNSCFCDDRVINDGSPDH